MVAVTAVKTWEMLMGGNGCRALAYLYMDVSD